jgi:hypothetical protein
MAELGILEDDQFAMIRTAAVKMLVARACGVGSRKKVNDGAVGTHCASGTDGGSGLLLGWTQQLFASCSS